MCMVFLLRPHLLIFLAWLHTRFTQIDLLSFPVALGNLQDRFSRNCFSSRQCFTNGRDGRLQLFKLIIFNVFALLHGCEMTRSPSSGDLTLYLAERNTLL